MDRCQLLLRLPLWCSGLESKKTKAELKQCAVCGPTVGVFVIQGGLEVEQENPVDKKHVSVTHNALSVWAKVVWKRGSADRGCVYVCVGRGARGPQGCRVWEASHSRCGKSFSSLQNTGAHLCTFTHRHGPMGSNCERKSTQQQGQRESGWVWMVSWVAPFSRAPELYWTLNFLDSRRPRPAREKNAVPEKQ